MKLIRNARALFGIALALMAYGVQAQTTPVTPSVTVVWDAITTMNDGTPIPSNATITYNLYGGHNAAGPWSAPVQVLGTSTVRHGVDVGPLCYYVTAVVNGKESLPSTTACINVTATSSTVPSAPGNVTVTLVGPGNG